MPTIAKHFISTKSDKDSEWKSIYIDGIETFYEINIEAVVRNKKTKRILKPMKPKTDQERGYRLSMSISGSVFNFYLHRLYGIIFLPIPEKYIEMGYDQRNLIVVAKDNDPYNLDLDNLKWETKSEQMKEGVKAGRVLAGEEHKLAKIDENTARKICEMLQDKKPVKEIKETLNIPTTRIIYYIKNRVSWKQISKDYKW